MFDIMILMIMEMMMMKMTNEITECVPSNRLPIVRIQKLFHHVGSVHTCVTARDRSNALGSFAEMSNISLLEYLSSFNKQNI